MDVDRTYTDTPYWQIDLSPGYQLLDGDTALLFSRYRFDSNADFGRMARQQRILAGIRDQARSWNKKLKLPGVVNTIMKTGATNLSADEMLKLAYWLVKLDGTRIKQIIVQGPGKMIDGKAVVVVDKTALAEQIGDFLTAPPADPGAAGAAAAGPTLLAAASDEAVRLALATAPTLPPAMSSTTAPKTTTTKPGAATTSTAKAATTTTATAGSTTTSAATTTTTAAQTTTTLGAMRDAAAWKAAQKTVPFTLEAPTYLPADFALAGKAPQGDGTYDIKTGDGTKPAVRMLYRYQQSDLYLGISATTWTEAPLATDGMAAQRNGVTYTVCGTLGKPDHVWWIKGGVLYWVSNTLMYTLGDQELLQIAEAMLPVSGGVATGGR